MNEKIPLLIRKRRGGWQPEGHHETPLKSSLPFYLSAAGWKFHRIRSGTLYWRDGKIHHTAFHLWCGQSGFDDGELFTEAPAAFECLRCRRAFEKFKLRPRPTCAYALPAESSNSGNVTV